VRLAAIAIWHDARADVSETGRVHAKPTITRTPVNATIGESLALGCDERLKLLNPAERGCPDQPVEADSSIGDQPNPHRTSRGKSRQSTRLSAGRRQLTGERANCEKHDAVATMASAK